MRRFGYAAIAGLAVANMVVWPYVLEGQGLRVTFFDVGQGDAIFLETEFGHRILIDGGPNGKVAEKVGQRLPFWIKSLDLVVLSHPDADHITGLVDIFRQYDVETVLWTGFEKQTNIFFAWERALEREEARVVLAEPGQKITWRSDAPDAYLEVLYPSAAEVRAAKQANDTSVIARLRYGEHSFLFPGDISGAVERQLVRQGVPLQARVLKVPHHGSKSSASGAFLAAVAPDIAVIQVGADNFYGHPHPDVLSRLANIPLLRTDLDGDIIMKITDTELTL